MQQCEASAANGYSMQCDAFCHNPAHSIVAENCLPGAPPTEWDVNGAGHEVEGFATRASLLPGYTVEFKIRSLRAEALRVDVYRHGYYQGLGARLVGAAEIVNHAAMSAQPECEPISLGSVDCGNWAVVARWPVPLNATSGLYFARAVLPTRVPGRWRADASRVNYDPHHAVAGSDPTLPPDGSLPHAYGAAGKNRLRNALREPRAAHLYFVVRARLTADPPETPTALLVQTSDTTAHAYNGYGGLTTYGSFAYPFEHAPRRAPLNLSEPGHDLRRAHKRSYNTPLVTRDYRAVNTPTHAELPAIMWLERNGYELHYAAGADMYSPRRAARLLRHSKAYLSVGHDEYWSYPQREAIERARAERGVGLSFWSANEAYWAIRFEVGRVGMPSRLDTTQQNARLHPPTTPYERAQEAAEEGELGRTLVCYKETQSVDKLDPEPGAWTGTFRDARPINPRGAMPENALSGTLFAANAQRVDSLVVDARAFGLHRIWRNTSVGAAAAEAGAEAAPVTVPTVGLLGHEWDEAVDNGWQPAALHRLSATTVDNVQVLQDHGATFDTGSATHALVLHRGPDGKGGLTFGAGTVQWSWGLEGLHDVNDPPRANKYAIRVARVDGLHGASRDVQQLTANVLAEQGLVAATPQADITPHPPSDDRDAPTGGVDRVGVDLRGVLRADGWARDRGGGVVASVEVRWEGGRWHAATLERVAAEARWSFDWGDEAWHKLHTVGDVAKAAMGLELRVSDDSHNVGLA